eukprot:538779_1
MHGIRDTAGGFNDEGKSEFEPTDKKLWQFLTKNNIKSKKIYNNLVSMSLTVNDLKGISKEDLNELCKSLQLSISEKIKFKKAVNSLQPSKRPNVIHNHQYFLSDEKCASLRQDDYFQGGLSMRKHADAYEVSITFIGGGGVGKTCLVYRVYNGSFLDGYDPTIEDTYNLRLKYEGLSPLCWEILDTAGQEDFTDMRTIWVRTCDVIVLVYSVDNYTSFTQVEEMFEMCKENALNCKLMMLVGNKCDLERPREVPQSLGYQLAEKYGTLFMEVSAKTKYNIQAFAYTLSAEILKTGVNGEVKDVLRLTDGKSGKKRKCC